MEVGRAHVRMCACVCAYDLLFTEAYVSTCVLVYVLVGVTIMII